ncbi:MAG: pyrroline-5-carboxylate reductase [Ruminococcaceae bacterium]|nr:pyrroline-5-carboxylate reductase [Oscillospiraceae bacterium]
MSEGMAQRIRELRKAKKLTLEQVARVVGVEKSTVRKWETGMIASMRWDKIAALARALGTTPTYLMGSKTDAPPAQTPAAPVWEAQDELYTWEGDDAMTIGFIGTGHMGGALARAAAKAVSPGSIYLANRTAGKAQALAEELGAVAADNDSIAVECDYIFLGVKPQMMQGLLDSLRLLLAARKTPCVLVTMAAGLSVNAIREMSGLQLPVIRIMPNVACAVGQGLTLYACSSDVTVQQKQEFLRILSASGALEELDEHLIDAGSAVAGCGGAFACLFLEALADGAVTCGLPRDKAMRYAQQMLLGTAALAKETGAHPGAIKDSICSPGGTTIAGVRALEAGGFRSAAMEAVIAAYDRTLELKK